MTRLGILGGTFNPPHIAHLIAADRAVEQFSLDTLLLIPASVPPHKVHHDIAPQADRLAMTRLAAENNPKFEVSDLEMGRSGPSYTIDTIIEVKQIYRPESVYLIIGLDMLAIFSSWHRSEEILKEATLVVMMRSTHDLDRIDPNLRAVVQRLEMPILDVSSTDVRTRVSAGKSIRYLVPEPVRAYIAEHNLYR